MPYTTTLEDRRADAWVGQLRSPLRGRHRERERLDALLTRVRSGSSQVLVLRGEMGIGKTALLDHLSERAAGCRVVRTTSVWSEMELAYAGLHQLCAPFLDRVPRLPGPQSEALEIAFGLREGGTPDRFLVGLAVLTLLSSVADEQPLVCIVDDAHWLDRPSAQALAFAARRLEEESVALVFGVREPNDDQEFLSLPALALDGLGDADARAVLDAAFPGPLDDRIRGRIVAETRGNPLALLEIPLGLTPEELAGGFGFSETPPLSGRIEASYARRLTALPDDTRRLLLVAAAEPLGDAVVVLRAADLLGLSVAAAAPAVAAGLVELGGQVRFRHPLVRRVVYQSSELGERQDVHRALAHASDPSLDPERRAWHRGQATAGLDEAVAAELEHSATRAQARAGLAAGAAFLQRAAELTPEPQGRAQRALDAAQSKHYAGAPEAALRLLTMAEAGPLDKSARARAALVRAQVEFAVTRGGVAPALLLAAARRLQPFDPQLTYETHRDALLAALSAGSLVQGDGLREVAEAVRSIPGAICPRTRLLMGLADLVTDGYVAAAETLRPALADLCAEPVSDHRELEWMWVGCTVARSLADDAAWDELSARQLELARRAGALRLLPVALTERLSYELLSGNLEAAAALAAEADVVTQATGAAPILDRAIWLSAWNGRDDQAAQQITRRRRDAVRRGEGQWMITTEWLTAVLFNGLGRYEDALTSAANAATHPFDIGLATSVLPELVEAAVRSGEAELAREPMRRLVDLATASGTDWARGLAARSEALLATGEAADALYREAIERLTRTRIRSALARAHLLYGEWLRRERRRIEARQQLRRAHALFEQTRAEGFAQRAQRELLATGETVRRRSPETRDDFTPQETEIARLAASGQTNSEIGAQLYLSPRTVEWHLRKVFGKLGINSRKQLGGALTGPSV